MKMKMPKLSISRNMSIYSDYLVTTSVNQAIQQIPGLPAPIKAVAGLTASFNLYGIMDKLVATLPKQVQGIAKALLEVQITMQVVQTIPQLIATFSNLSASFGGAGGSGGFGVTSYATLGPQAVPNF